MLGTLGGATGVRGVGTLGGYTVMGATLGDAGLALIGEVTVWKISASFRIAVSCSCPSVAKGAAGAGCFSASTRSSAAWVAASEEEVPGMAQL